MSRIIAVTGATGFVGAPLSEALSRRGERVRRLLRRPPDPATPAAAGDDAPVVGEIGPQTDWSSVLQGVACVVHCAASVHGLHQSPADKAESCRRVNREGTLRLAEAAAAAGVRRLIFLSSIKVNGERTAPGEPFRSDTPPAPQDAYGTSKWDAERGLQAIAGRTGLEVVVIRPPLVHGPGVRANMLRLLRLVDRGIPLPLGAIRNSRSSVSRDNLIDLLLLCLDHPAAAGGTFLVADDWSPSTPELVGCLADALGRPSRLLPVPPELLRRCGALAGRSEEIRRLTDSLVVDASATSRRLGWTPPTPAREGLRRTAAWYRSLNR